MCSGMMRPTTFTVESDQREAAELELRCESLSFTC